MNGEVEGTHDHEGEPCADLDVHLGCGIRARQLKCLGWVTESFLMFTELSFSLTVSLFGSQCLTV